MGSNACTITAADASVFQAGIVGSDPCHYCLPCISCNDCSSARSLLLSPQNCPSCPLPVPVTRSGVNIHCRSFSLFLSCRYHHQSTNHRETSTSTNQPTNQPPDHPQNLLRPGKSIIAKKGEESQVKESSDSNTTVEEEEVKGKQLRVKTPPVLLVPAHSSTVDCGWDEPLGFVSNQSRSSVASCICCRRRT